MLKLLREKKNATKPFFIYLAFQGSHNPREAPDEYCELYEGGMDTGLYDLDY